MKLTSNGIIRAANRHHVHPSRTGGLAAAHTSIPAGGGSAAPSSSSSTGAGTRHYTASIVRSSSSDEGSTSGSSSSEVSVAVGSPPGAGGGKDALLARIAKAKAYKQQDDAGSSSSSSTSPTFLAAPPSTVSSASSSEDLTEEQQEAMQQQYLQQLRQQQAQASSEGSAYSQYIQQTSASSQGSGDASQSPNALDRLAEQDPTPQARPPPARQDFYTNPKVPELQQLLSSAPIMAGSGSADEAAAWLKGVLQPATPDQQSLNSNMRPEEFTAAKETATRQRGAEIITAFPEEYEPAPADASTSKAAAGVVAGDDDYKPKVTTWGVFSRPKSISEAYGGGRTIRPGQALETPEQKAQRQAEYAAALQMYKASVFTDSLSDAELAAAQSTFNEGMTLFKRGALTEALERFDEVREKVPLKSKLGGLSTLQAAVCYDTLGEARKAEGLYQRIRGHPTSEVSRKAKQLVFGFQAMTFLKADTISYAVKKEDYMEYFRRAADRNRTYVASEEERAAGQAEAERAALVALAVVLGPVIIMGGLLAGTKLG